ncbi:RIMS-binding protein 2 isoform X7 [Heterodontus francisci]|uniref:RIMS-binding protein 2 isoform X7 n=1 Tax=Heterodontus francisci TaxID=7792 RepID=UPI00355C6A47
MWSPEQLRNELLSVQPAGPQKNIQHLRLLEERNRTLGADITVPYQEKQQERFIETELNKKRKECEILGEEVQKKQRTCQTLENELKEILHEKCHWSLQPPVLSQKVLQYDQVKPEYDHLKETLTLVTQERDLAVKEKDQLRDKLENLEQLLKHMREAAGRRQQLELEHVQALAILNTKQQEIEVLRKAQVEAKKEHEGAVLLLEAKVRELEEKCRSQSEQFNLLSRELEKFRQTAGKIDLLSCPVSVSESPVSPCKSQSQLVNGLATSLGKGNESPYGSRSVISEYIRPLQMSGGKPELLSVKPTFLSRSRPSSPRQGRLSEMDIELDGANPKMKYTGRVHLCIARYSYNPYEGPNENPEAELPLKAGKYLYVYGDMDEDGFYEGELMDGRRGLVPSNFVALLQDDELFLFHSVDTEMDNNLLNSDVNHMGLHLHGDSMLQDSKANSLLPSQTETTMYNNGTGTVDMNIDEIGEDIVPYPRKINLIKQLAKSVIVGWEPAAVPPGWGTINSYNVLVDKEVRSNIPFGGRTKALIEKLNLVNVTYRISIQSVTDRGTSDELRCTLLVGKDVCVAPSHLKVENITQVSAEVSWLPSNSNYSHVIFLNEEEYDIVKASSYKYQFFNLKPCMTCKIKAVAQPHQVPWQLPLEQREKKDSVVEFCTLPAGPPAPPQDVMVQVGSTPGTIQISWKPPLLSSSGTSNGARVTGYSVCAKGQKVAEVMLATANGVTVDYLRIQNLETREIIVRTISAQGESEDSYAAAIPTDLLVPPTPQLRPASRTKPLASARAPDTKDQPIGPNLRRDESWEQTHSPSPFHGHSLEPTLPNHYGPSTNRSGRSPSPQRILPQPQGTPIPNTVAKAIAREAAQRVAENNRAEKRSIFSERSKTLHQENSDDEEDVYDGQIIKRPSGSVDDFLRGSELGRQQHYGHADDYHTESSRGSDLSDIMEEDEEELYSEMQLDEGGRRRHSVTSHNALKILGNPSGSGRMSDRMDHLGRRASHGSTVQRGRPMTVPSIEITVDSNSEGGRSRSGSEGNISPAREDAYYRNIAGRRKWPLQRSMTSENQYGRYCGRERLSPEVYEESEADVCSEDLLPRVFVALFDYDPLSMSPNPDAAEEELPFKEGQIIKVRGTKDADGFYHGETNGRVGLIPCNMVSEIQTDDEEMMDQLVKQGYLPLNTPVEKIERNRRSSRQHLLATRRMVALYDYDPRESSPNVDVEAELTFCAGDIISVWGELDEDGFYYGEINGQKGLVPSNFLEEVPDDVEVYLSDAPSRYPQDAPVRVKGKRVPGENIPRRAPSPTVHPHHHHHHSGAAIVDGPDSPMWARDMASKKKKGLLSKGKKLLRKLGGVK